MNKKQNKTGIVLPAILIVMLILSILSLALMRLHELHIYEITRRFQAVQTFWVAEAGLQKGLKRLRKETVDPQKPVADIGIFSGGEYQYKVTIHATNTTFTLYSTGKHLPTAYTKTLKQIVTLSTNFPRKISFNYWKEF